MLLYWLHDSYHLLNAMDAVLLLLGITSVLVLYLCVFHQIHHKILSFITQSQNPDALEHNDITDCLVTLGHPNFDGVCYGFTLNWALAVAKQEADYFYRQLDLLRDYRQKLPSTLARITFKKNNDLPLSEEEHVLLTLPDLCTRICIAQDPQRYKETYGKLIWQPDINLILHKITPRESTNQIFYKTHTFASRQQAVAYFNHLIEYGIDSGIAVIISTANHAMGFMRANSAWHFMNINTLYAQNPTYPYSIYTSQELVNELYRVCTASPFSKRLTVNTDFIALTTHGYHRLLNSLEHVFPMAPNGVNTAYIGEQISYFAMAALQGDSSSVKECLKNGLSIFSGDRLHKRSPITIAIEQGRREVVQAMIDPIKHRINYRDKSDNSTLLHIACRSGSAGIVSDLLGIKGIAIDSKDNEGMTPLMHACSEDTTMNEPEVFTQLLKKGASLTIKDNNGRTAMDHAIINNHQLAQRLLHRTTSTGINSFFQPGNPINTDSSQVHLTRTY